MVDSIPSLITRKAMVTSRMAAAEMISRSPVMMVQVYPRMLPGYLISSCPPDNTVRFPSGACATFPDAASAGRDWDWRCALMRHRCSFRAAHAPSWLSCQPCAGRCQVSIPLPVLFRPASVPPRQTPMASLPSPSSLAVSPMALYPMSGFLLAPFLYARQGAFTGYIREGYLLP